MTYDDRKINDEDNIDDVNYDEDGLDGKKENSPFFEKLSIIIDVIEDIITNL